MVADRYRVSPQYDFDGYWYDTESAYGYRRHRVSVRVDDRRAALRPRLTAGYVFSQLGNEAYLAGPWLEGRLTLLHKDRSYLWAKFEAALVEAPGERYDALSGHSLQGTLSAYTPAGEGWVYGALTARYLDRGSNATTVNGKAVTLDYSYASVEPLVAASQPLPWGGLTANGSLRYEARRYADPDTWTGGARRRVDHRFTARLAVERPVWKRVDVELSWRGQVRRSNITAADYRDRDYTRNLYGVFLKGDF